MSTSGGYTPPGAVPVPECSYVPAMTRAAALALVTAGTLDPNCVVVITDGPTIGTAGNTSGTQIELNPVSPTQLGLTARVTTGFDNEAWAGLYDIDTNLITRLEDNKGNVVDDPSGVMVATVWPWHNTSIARNQVEGLHTLTGWATLGGVNISDNVFQGPPNTVAVVGSGGSITLRGNTFKGASALSLDVTSGGTLNLTDNEFDAGIVTRAAGVTANMTLTRNRVQAATIAQKAGSTSGATAINDSIVRDGFIVSASGTGALTIQNSTLENHGTIAAAANGDLQHASAATTFITDSKIVPGVFVSLNNSGGGGSMTLVRVDQTSGIIIKNGGSTGTMTLQDLFSVGGLIQQQNAAAAGALSVANTTMNQGSVNQQGPGAITVNTCVRIESATIQNSATATRALIVTQSAVLDASTLSQNRTGGTGSDQVMGSTIDSVSTVNLNGAVDPGINQTVLNRCRIAMTSTVTVTDPAAVAILLQNMETHNAVVASPAGGGLVVQARFAMCNVNLGAFNGHGELIIDGLPALKTLTAVNVNKLANFSFDNTL